ncbi:MAG: 2,3-bisphosphoglycerate-independent phosphoglycerate mutase [Bacteroidetes bacterium]|nr:2,3-bisphosphoglycerate-independent phosphoglycerate mutase [Bacteroidota bacterium]
MDGWGINDNPSVDAIAQADTPFVDSLYQLYPNTRLVTFGEQVGLPHGQMGNSEVGHMNLGAGRIVYQDFLRINNAIKDGSFFTQSVLLDAFEYARKNDKKVHFLGLVSDGGVHSHIDHLKALVNMAQDSGVQKSYIHVITDGRDTDPEGSLQYVTELENHCKSTPTKIASLIGRYYAMDRDKRWERVKLAYDLLVDGKGSSTNDLLSAIQQSYQEGVTDEFILPIVAEEDNRPVATIEADDVVICFNFRTDRCRQITEVLTQKDHSANGMHTLPLYYVTMTRYDDTFNDIKVVYDKNVLNNTIGEVISNAGLTQLRIAETEKYPHVSFFFSGGRETIFEGEDRAMINSPKVATYDLQPEMSAYEVKDTLLAKINNQPPDFFCLNFANTDMVGHTGVFKAAMKAAETVDSCLKEVITACLEKDYTIFLTADHGNADVMINEDGSPNTAHSKNPVPLFVISKNYKGRVHAGKLSDLAPSILKVMGLEIPKEMTGEILLDKDN